MKRLDFSNRDLERKILSILPKYDYRGAENVSGVWLESILNEPVFESIKVTPSTVPDALPFLDRYLTEYSIAPEYVTYYSECLKLLSGIASEISLENIEFFKRGITFCPRLKLPQLFQEGLSPLFFGTFTGGEIIIVKTSLSYWRRAGFTRLLYTLSHYPNAVLDQGLESFESLRKWNGIEPEDFLSIILHIAQYLFFPYVSSFTASHGIGLKFIFIPSQPFEYTRASFPADWMDFLRSDTELAEEGRASPEKVEELFTKPQRSIYGKHVFKSPPSANDTRELMGWAIRSANAVVTKLYDVTNFSLASSDKTIDPVYGQEYVHSFMHVLRDAASIIAENSRYRNKATTFRIADILSAIVEQGSLEKPSDKFFQELFRCDIGKPEIKNILCNTGIGALRALADASDEIYDNLKRTLVHSVFIPSKRQSNGISVRTSSLDSERITSEDEFCGQVVRALRNTQHGYFTRGDRSSRPSRFLSLIDGNTPDDFPTLALAWTLALLASPKDLVGDP